jgi:hypothetical protein
LHKRKTQQESNGVKAEVSDWLQEGLTDY